MPDERSEARGPPKHALPQLPLDDAGRRSGWPAGGAAPTNSSEEALGIALMGTSREAASEPVTTRGGDGVTSVVGVGAASSSWGREKEGLPSAPHHRVKRRLQSHLETRIKDKVDQQLRANSQVSIGEGRNRRSLLYLQYPGQLSSFLGPIPGV